MDLENLRNSFARILRKRRMAKGLSQVDLAASAGIENSYVSRLEGGTRTPSLDVIVRLANAFSITPERLVKEVRLESENTSIGES